MMKMRVSKRGSLQNYMSSSKDAFRFIWKEGKILFLLYGTGVLANPALALCTTVLPAMFLGNLATVRADRLTAAVFLDVCAPAILYFFLESVVLTLYYVISQRAEKRILARMSLRMHKRSSEILGKIDARHFDNPETYDTIHNGSQYDISIANNIAKRPFGMLGDIITYVGYLLLLLPMGVIPVIILTFSILITYFLSARIEEISDETVRRSANEQRRYDFFLEILLKKTNLQELRIYGLFTFIKSRLEKSHHILMDYSLRESKSTISCSVLSYLISAIPAWGCLVYTVFLVYSGNLNISQFFVMNAAIENYVVYTQVFVDMFSQMRGESLKLERHREFCEIKNEILSGDTQAAKPEVSLPDISFQGVSMSYHNSAVMALQDISFSVPGGSIVSIVGPNGSGKSTLVKLLTRLYDPSSGEICINGCPLKDVNAQGWYDNQGVLFQNYHLFALSVKDNIGFGEVDRSKIIAASDAAACSSVIARFPKEYDTMCGKEFDEQGVEFSGGESQRICLARAIYRDAGIWILDEPSAAIDPVSEDSIFDFICSQRGQRTVFVVSHRLSIARRSDLILVLNNGRLEEMGDHNELMKHNGLYTELFASQMEGYR